MTTFFRSSVFRCANIVIGSFGRLVHGIYGPLQRWTLCTDGFAALALETRLLNNGAWAKRWVLNAPQKCRGRPPFNFELSGSSLFYRAFDRRDEQNSPANQGGRGRFTTRTAATRAIKASLVAGPLKADPLCGMGGSPHTASMSAQIAPRGSRRTAC